MAEVKITHIDKILSALKKSNRKYVSLEDLSKAVGLYPDVLGEELSYFDPMIMLDSTKNIRDLERPIEQYLAEREEERVLSPLPKRVVASNKELAEYPTIASFVYKKMTFAGGLVDPSTKLNDHDLHLLQKLVNKEVLARKHKSRKKSK
jgi:hypothetical protein